MAPFYTPLNSLVVVEITFCLCIVYIFRHHCSDISGQEAVLEDVAGGEEGTQDLGILLAQGQVHDRLLAGRPLDQAMAQR